MQEVARLGTKAGVERRPVTMRAPLIRMSKAEIIRAGVALGVDYGLTHSCYDPTPLGRRLRRLRLLPAPAARLRGRRRRGSDPVRRDPDSAAAPGAAEAAARPGRRVAGRASAAHGGTPQGRAENERAAAARARGASHAAGAGRTGPPLRVGLGPRSRRRRSRRAAVRPRSSVSIAAPCRRRGSGDLGRPPRPRTRGPPGARVASPRVSASRDDLARAATVELGVSTLTRRAGLGVSPLGRLRCVARQHEAQREQDLARQLAVAPRRAAAARAPARSTARRAGRRRGRRCVSGSSASRSGGSSSAARMSAFVGAWAARPSSGRAPPR